MDIIRKVGLFFRIISSSIAKKEDTTLQFDKSGQSVSDYIEYLLQNDNPVMIARFGSVELQCLVDYLHKPSIKNFCRFSSGKINSFGYSKSTKYAMGNNAGFFPVSDENLDKFSQLMINCTSEVDVLGSWQLNENFFLKELRNSIKVPLGDLEPYFHQKPWSEVLRGKKVLIIHPFEESIREQYKKRELLFVDKRVLPLFDLKIIKAVQTIANNPSDFSTWFEALNHMKKQIDQCDFDIAIIGCGAYGFPLAAYVKSIGKKAVHLGGATQMLFGIKSKAWEDLPQFNNIINEFWVNPKESEKPKNYQKVESGRYW